VVERWLAVAEGAERLRLSTATLCALWKRGAPRHARVANAIRIDEQALQEFLGAAK
jgi:hypothetical protein